MLSWFSVLVFSGSFIVYCLIKVGSIEAVHKEQECSSMLLTAICVSSSNPTDPSLSDQEEKQAVGGWYLFGSRPVRLAYSAGSESLRKPLQRALETKKKVVPFFLLYGISNLN